MKNPIPYSEMFRDFDCLNELMNFLDKTYSGSERAQMYQVAMFTLNACHKRVNDEMRIAGLLTEESSTVIEENRQQFSD